MSGEDREEASRRRRWLALASTLAILALGVAVAARTVDLDAALDAATTADPRLLALAAITYAASWPLRGRRYADALAPIDRRLTTTFSTLAVFLSQTANLVLPARAGDGVRAVVLRRRRAVAYPSAGASLTVERAFDLLALAAIGGLAFLGTVAIRDGATLELAAERVARAAPAVPTPGPAVPLAGPAVPIGLALVAVPLVAAIAHPPSRRRGIALGRSAVARLPDWLPSGVPDRLVAGVRTFAYDLGTVARSPRSLALVAGGSLAIWTLDAATAVLVLAAVVEPGTAADPTVASPTTVVVVGTLAVAAGNLAKVLPLTQGGLGLYEGAFAATVVALSPVAGAVALAAAVLDHALKNGVTLAGGVVAGAVLGVDPDSLAAEDRPERGANDATGPGAHDSPRQPAGDS